MKASMKAITAGRYGTKMAAILVNTKNGSIRIRFPLYSVKLYEAKKRQSDGALTWRFVEHLTKGHSWEPTVDKWAASKAVELGIQYAPGLVHGMTHTPEPEPPAPIVWDEGDNLLD